MKALRVERKLHRFAAARVAGEVVPGRGARVGPLRYADEADAPDLPGPGWQVLRPRLAGICGSDLSMVDGHTSRYFEPIVSFPFVPGHEVVADAEDGRVVVEPVLGCVARNVVPPCPACARGDLGGCERLAFGDLAPGLQTGFCCDTGGGWSTQMVAHQSQLHTVPDDWPDERAVMVEPTACAVHAALSAGVVEGDLVVVIGAGTLGILTVAALRRLTPAGTIISTAKHPEQRRWVKELGADVVSEPAEVPRLVRRLSRSMAYRNQLTGGADAVLDCVGDSGSLTQSLALVKPRGQVTVVGMPASVTLDLTTLWHRETKLAGAYAYGTETLDGGERRRTFDLAFELAAELRLERLVSARYRLSEYRDAIEHAAAAGRRGAVKVVFDLTGEKGR